MWIELFVVISDGSLYFYGISGDIPFIVFLLHLFDSSPFSFFLIWLGVYFVDLFKKPAPRFIDFLKGFFFVSISFSSTLILVISCLLLAFEFFWSSSSSSFNFDDTVSTLDIYLFLLWAFIAVYFPLNTALKVSRRFW